MKESRGFVGVVAATFSDGYDVVDGIGVGLATDVTDALVIGHDHLAMLLMPSLTINSHDPPPVA